MESKTRITHIIDNLSVGGAEKQLALFSRYLNPNKYRQTIICMREGGVLEGKIRKAGVEILVLKRKFKIDPFFFIRLVAVLKQTKPDIIHCWLFSPNLWGRLASFFVPGAKIIASERVEGVWKGFYHRFIDKVLLKWKTDILLVNSRGVIKYCTESEGFGQEKLRLVLNAVENTMNTDKPETEVRKVVTISRLTPQKRVDRFIEVASKILEQKKKVRFYIYGEGEERSYYENDVKKRQLDTYIQFMGKMPVDCILKDADLFISTSSYEGLPNGIMEAMSYGLPIVATNIGGTNELIESKKTGILVEQDDITQMANQALALLEDTEYAKRLGIQAKEKIKTEYHISKIIKDLEKIYDELIPR